MKKIDKNKHNIYFWIVKKIIMTSEYKISSVYISINWHPLVPLVKKYSRKHKENFERIFNYFSISPSLKHPTFLIFLMKKFSIKIMQIILEKNLNLILNSFTYPSCFYVHIGFPNLAQSFDRFNMTVFRC